MNNTVANSPVMTYDMCLQLLFSRQIPLCCSPRKLLLIYSHGSLTHIYSIFISGDELGTKLNPWLWNIREKLYPDIINSIVLSTNGWLLCNYSFKCRLSINSKVPNLISDTVQYIPISNIFTFLQQQFYSTPFQRMLRSLLEVRLCFSYSPYFINDAPLAFTAGTTIKIPQILGLAFPTVPDFQRCGNEMKILPKEPALFQPQQINEMIEIMKNETELLLSDCFCI